MDRALLRTRTVSDSRSSYGRGSASNSLGRTQSVRRTEPRRLSQSYLAKRQKEALKNYSEGEIATRADCPKDTANSWKQGRRTANTSYTLTMARSIDEIGLMIAEEADLGRFYGHDDQIRRRLVDIAMREDQQGALARSILRELERT